MASGSRGSRTPHSHSSGRLTATNTNTATATPTPTATATATENPRAATATDAVSKVIAQYTQDARLHAVFEQSRELGLSFNYSQSVKASSLSAPPDHQITAYLSKIQRGSHIQPFGCTLAFDESSFRVIAYSENAPELLDLSAHHSVPTLDRRPDPLTIGTDLRSLLTPSSSSAVEQAVLARDLNLQNPLLIQSRASGRPFYAILHRIDVGIVVDLEPVRLEDPGYHISGYGYVKSQKLAIRFISRLQALPSGDIKLLCDTVVDLVRELTGYDRVMVYKFHEDEHGEVIAESRRPELEPYLGLHYPATDIPQASRFLFKQNRVRMICDCRAAPVRVIQDESLTQPLCLVGSTLRAPHSCHSQYMANMGSIASLAMAVIINSPDDEVSPSASSSSHSAAQMKLWGLVVCHHASPRCVSFAIRSACEILMQAFSVLLNMDLQLAIQMSEKRILKTQTLLCDMILRDSPTGIVTQSPSIMDLVKCDGAAMFYRGRYYSLGVTPTEAQIKDIIQWLSSCRGGSIGLSTDSLAEAGYPGAAALGDAVCGMAVAYTTTKDYLFWFRSHTAKEIRWGGAKHDPKDKDDGQRMHPRSSFNAFLEVVKNKTLPWETAELDAIHSLQLILRDTIREAGEGANNSNAVINVEVGDLQVGIDDLYSVTREMVRVIETAPVPVFGVDLDGRIDGWNSKVAELTGLTAEDAIGKSLVHDLVLNESVEVVDKLLSRALRGEEDKNVEIKLKTFGSQEQKKAVFVVVNACSSMDNAGNIHSVCFMGPDVTGQKLAMDKFINIQGDYKAIVHNPNPLIPPIFGSDENTCCSEWNTAMEKLTGWPREEMEGKMLVGEIFGSCCQLRGADALTKFMVVVHNAIGGQDTDKFPFSFYDKNRKFVQALLTANTKRDTEGRPTGAFCFVQIASPELQQALEIQRQQEKKYYARMKELAYICQEIKNPLNGIRFTNVLLDATGLNCDQKQLLETCVSCERQLSSIIKDANLQCIEDGSLAIEKNEFLLGSVIDAVVFQAMLLLRKKGLQIMRDIPEEIKDISAYGDQYRIQQVLAGFLVTLARSAPSEDGWVEIQVKLTRKRSPDGTETILFLFRFACPGDGLPPEMVQDMFHNSRWDTQEGLALSISRKLVKLMGGEVQYIRESERCFFLISLELPNSGNDGNMME